MQRRGDHDRPVGGARAGRVGARRRRAAGSRATATRTGARPGGALTLIEAEALEDVGLTGPESRRQVVVRGVRLNDLVGKRFRVGDVECVGVELCEPCLHLESLTRPGIIEDLLHRGGLNADILVGGTIAVGDPVVVARASAGAAGAAEHDVVPGDRVAGAALDLAERALELVVLERLDPPAVAADEVVMVLAARMGRLEASDAGAEVDALEQALLRSAARARGRCSRSRRGAPRRGARRRSPARSGSSPAGRGARRPRGVRARCGSRRRGARRACAASSRSADAVAIGEDDSRSQ